MIADSNTPHTPWQSDRRGQSAVLGVVLLLGFTVVAGSALALTGFTMLQSGQDATSHTHAENEMSVLASKVANVALGDSSIQQATFGSNGGGYEVVEDAGTMTVSIDGEEIHNVTMGAVVYENGDNVVAYQGGGVWSSNGESTTMVTPPEFHYEDDTLTLPMINVTGSSQLRGGGEATIRPGLDPVAGTTTEVVYPNAEENRTNPVVAHTITVTVESEYHEGWEQYFDERTAEEPYSPGDNQVAVDLETDRDMGEVGLDGPDDTILLSGLKDEDPLDQFYIHGVVEQTNVQQIDWNVTAINDDGEHEQIFHIEGHDSNNASIHLNGTEYEIEVDDHRELLEVDLTEGEMGAEFNDRITAFGTDVELHIHDYRMEQTNDNDPSFEYGTGGTFIDVEYDIGEDEIKYLHVTENTVQVDLN